MHHLATNPNVPDCLRAAFARVRFQVVAIKSDGTEVVANAITEESRDRLIAEYEDAQRYHAVNGTSYRDGTTIARIEVRNIGAAA